MAKFDPRQLTEQDLQHRFNVETSLHYIYRTKSGKILIRDREQSGKHGMTLLGRARHHCRDGVRRAAHARYRFSAKRIDGSVA